MLTAIIAGERNPKILAQMARTRMRGKIAQLEEALDCSFFTEQHAFILQMMLANIDHLTTQVKELDIKIAELCQPYQRQIAQLDAVPGYGVTTAQDIIAEIGVDMTVFPTPGHLCSWARQRADIARRARSHARAIERLGYRVTIEPLSSDPETAELPVTKAS
jgi:transposase